MDSQRAKNFVTEAVAIHPEMPWLDIHGRTLPDDVLKIESKSWSEKTWDTYLKTIETPISESLTSATSFQAALDSGNCINDFLATAAKPSTRVEIRSALQQLTTRQSSIIKMTYWSGISEREIASTLGVSRSTVKVLKKRALMRLRTRLREAGENITRIEGTFRAEDSVTASENDAPRTASKKSA